MPGPGAPAPSVQAKRATQAASTRRDDKLSLRVWLRLMKCSRAVEAEANGRLRRGYGQSLTRFDALSQLYRFDPEWVTVGTLAEHMLQASNNITALLDRMEAEGQVERRASPVDRRSYQVRMTAEGRALFDAMARDHARWIDAVWEGIPEADKERLVALLVDLRRATETETGTADAAQ